MEAGKSLKASVLEICFECVGNFLYLLYKPIEATPGFRYNTSASLQEEASAGQLLQCFRLDLVEENLMSFKF